MEKEGFIFRRAKIDDILSVMKVIENRCLWMKENGINQWDEEYLKLYDFKYFKSKVENRELFLVENFQKISDYSAFLNLQNLKSLEISGDGLSPKFIHIESLEFLRQMPGLSSLVILTARLKSKDYSPILSLKSLTHLSLPPQHALFGLFDELSALPNLKTGLLKERAEIYHRK